MALAQAPGAYPVGPVDARAARRTLRAEKAQLAHWRRLLRARLDIAVAGLAPPEQLGAFSWDLLPDAVLDLPRPEELATAVTVRSIEDPVDLMNRLRLLDKALSRYADRLDAALELSTHEVLAGMAGADEVGVEGR